MSAYYGFQRPVVSTAPPDVTRRVPDGKFSSTLVADMRAAWETPGPPTVIPTCQSPQPCQTWVQFKPQLSECGPTFVSWREATQGQVPGVEIAPRDSKQWIADLNEMHYRRALVSGAIWEAESTRSHIRNRQLMAQYLQSTLYPQSSPHEKRLDGVRDAYGVLVRQYGAPQYTSF